MNRIKVLPENIANKIAAGEVVQRPSSVLKELIENSLDAGADNIEVFIKSAGKSLIQIVDNGSGMSEEEAIDSFKRHSTSKISSIEDLERINTFGFRGEALSSISSVAKIEMKTSIDDELGTILTSDDGIKITVSKGKFPKGTFISVKNLFYNTPARRNFLKSHTTELKHLIDTFNRSALSQPNVSMKFWNSDDLLFDYKACNQQERIKQVIADNIFDAIIEVGEETDLLDIKGFIAKPTFLKKSKGEQYLFVNGRYVVSKTINHAVFSAYENLLERGEYPFFIIFIDLDPSRIDVNVHPAKLEIKFEHENDVYRIVKSIVRKSIGQYDLTPNISFSGNDSHNTQLLNSDHKHIQKNDFSDRPTFERKHGRKEDHIFSTDELDLLFEKISPESKKNSPQGSPTHPFDETDTTYTHQSKVDEENNKSSTSEGFLISLHNKYILSPIKSGLMVIDQHVAHERILYEKALNSFESDIPFSQQLLFAQTLQVDP
ncbi:MAG: DNA mismatch repair endonuclease MutL, partial [Bacteroidota bacterium]